MIDQLTILFIALTVLALLGMGAAYLLGWFKSSSSAGALEDMSEDGTTTGSRGEHDRE